VGGCVRQRDPRRRKMVWRCGMVDAGRRHRGIHRRGGEPYDGQHLHGPRSGDYHGSLRARDPSGHGGAEAPIHTLSSCVHACESAPESLDQWHPHGTSCPPAVMEYAAPALHGRGTLESIRDPLGAPASLALAGPRLLLVYPETAGDATAGGEVHAVTTTRAGRWLVSLTQRRRGV
jgi:hypothetical protein